MTVGRPFEPGQSGNPGGRPKDWITKHLRARSEAEGKKLADALWRAAMKGNMVAMSLVLDRVEGKVPDEGKYTVEAGDTLAGALRSALGR